MKQILQNIENGETSVLDVPAPVVRAGALLIGSTVSLVSAGTERMLLEFGKANLIEKARQQPDKVRQVFDKMRTDGIVPTLKAVQAKLDRPIPLGYCNVGVVLEVGAGVSGFAAGDRVISNGHHAEVVCVPENLCAKIPDGVSDEEASFTVIGAIGLQGVRLVQPTLGENVVVTGLGLIGLLTVQLLRANGCNVLGVDPDPERSAMAERFGARVCRLAAGEDPLDAARTFSEGRGVDAVIITASSTSNELMHQAAQMCRKRGRIVLIGVTGLELSRADFYEKELTFQVSCSYGPGRYDANYEEKGQDYPFGYVRWTEQRNFAAVLGLMASRRLDASSLVSHRFDIAQATGAYDALTREKSLGIVLHYPRPSDTHGGTAARERIVRLVQGGPAGGAGTAHGTPCVSMIGAGNYAAQVLIPGLRASGAHLGTLVSAGGVSSVYAGRKFGFENAATDPLAALEDPAADAVVIATRHDTHADYTLRALRTGKHVFVEKPLAMTRADIAAVEKECERAGQATRAPILMVGFNRRFAPQVVKMSQLLGARSDPKCMVMTVNAGAIPAEHWTQDERQGGGRILGEACHFIDLLRFLAGAPIRKVSAVRIGDVAGERIRDDKATITLEFDNGSIGSVHYFANGHKSFPKERLEVYCGGGILQLDNFRRLQGFGWKEFSKMNLMRQDKGNAACIGAFVEAIRTGGPSPIPLAEIVEVSRATLDAVDAMQTA
jgi:predicted dehydrogenase